MNFKDARSVEEVVFNMRTADLYCRSGNRARIDTLFNGDPPYSEDEVAQRKISTNVNTLESTKIAQDARAQVDHAALDTDKYFSVSLDEYLGTPNQIRTWGTEITNALKCYTKSCPVYEESLRATNAQFVLHGRGPVSWSNSQCWAPYEVAVEDLLIPTGTYVGFRNLENFGIVRRWTVSELAEMALSPEGDKAGWNQPMVAEIIKNLNFQTGKPYADTMNWPWTALDRVAERIKENSGLWWSDVSPTIQCVDFYYKSDPNKNGESTILRRVVLDGPDYNSALAGSSLKEGGFLFSSGTRKFADNIGQILHVQIGNGANVAPFRYHSVRGLGFMLYAVCLLSNRLFSMSMDNLFRELQIWFKNVAPADRDKILAVEMDNMMCLPEGVSVVPAQERYSSNENLVQAGAARCRQLMSENSSSFTQDINDGTAKEMTAHEALLRAHSASTLLNSMIAQWYRQEKHQDIEICRRFCVANSRDPDVKKFRKRVLSRGVPEKALDVEYWDVTHEQAIGGGSKGMAISEAQLLVQMIAMFPPESQRKILHIFTEAVTGKPDVAQDLAPVDTEPQPSQTAEKATMAWGTLIDGKPVVTGSDIVDIEWIDILLGILGQEVATVVQSGQMPTMQRVQGMKNVLKNIWEHVGNIEADKNQAERVRQYTDQLGKLTNQVMGLEQRVQEQMQAQAEAQQGPQMDPEVQSKIISDKAITDAKVQSMNELTQAAEYRKNVLFKQKLEHSQEKHMVEVASTDLKTQAEIVQKHAQSRTDMAIAKEEAKNEPPKQPAGKS